MKTPITRQALAEHIADRFSHGLSDQEIAHGLRDVGVVVTLGYVPKLADMIGVIRDLMLDRPLSEEDGE